MGLNDEYASAPQTQFAADARSGLELLDLNQTVTFTKYVKTVLPLDGYVFWVKADLLSDSALLNSSNLNETLLNDSPTIATPADQIQVNGSLHFSYGANQGETENKAILGVRFTSEQEIQDFKLIDPQTIYIGEFLGSKFAFSATGVGDNGRGGNYEQAGIFHYYGEAINPVLLTQIIDDPTQLDTSNVITSNSLAFWLGMDATNPVAQYRPTQGIKLYPSFLVPQNLPPTYGVVSIDPETTSALQAFPRIDSNYNHYQLVTEKVKITLYGLRNFNALDFVDYVINYSEDTDNFGIMNMPVIRDEKRNQVELSIIAMKKTVEFEINYYQTRIVDVARQLILQAIPTVNFGGLPQYIVNTDVNNNIV